MVAIAARSARGEIARHADMGSICQSCTNCPPPECNNGSAIGEICVSVGIKLVVRGLFIRSSLLPESGYTLISYLSSKAATYHNSISNIEQLCGGACLSIEHVIVLSRETNMNSIYEWDGDPWGKTIKYSLTISAELDSHILLCIRTSRSLERECSWLTAPNSENVCLNGIRADWKRNFVSDYALTKYGRISYMRRIWRLLPGGMIHVSEGAYLQLEHARLKGYCFKAIRVHTCRPRR